MIYINLSAQCLAYTNCWIMMALMTRRLKQMLGVVPLPQLHPRLLERKGPQGHLEPASH